MTEGPKENTGASDGVVPTASLPTVGIVGRQPGPLSLLAGVLRLNRVSVSAVISSREDLRAIAAPPTVLLAYVQSSADIPFVREIGARFAAVPVYLLDAREPGQARADPPGLGLGALSVPKPPAEIVAWVRDRIRDRLAGSVASGRGNPGESEAANPRRTSRRDSEGSRRMALRPSVSNPWVAHRWTWIDRGSKRDPLGVTRKGTRGGPLGAPAPRSGTPR